MKRVYILTQILGQGQLTEREIFRGVFTTYELAKKAEANYRDKLSLKNAVFCISGEELDVARKVW